jgi:hypothetical protein
VTMAVSKVPNRAGASNPTVLTVLGYLAPAR